MNSMQNSYNPSMKLYNYTLDLDLSKTLLENSNQNSTNQDAKNTEKINEFLKPIINYLENNLKNYIRLHQKGFEIYKQKLLSDKKMILNSTSKDIGNWKVNKLIEELTKLKNNQNTMKNNLIDNSSLHTLNNIVSLNNNDNKIENKHQFIGFKNGDINDPKLIYHSPSPLIFKNHESKINATDANQLDFDEPQNLAVKNNQNNIFFNFNQNS